MILRKNVRKALTLEEGDLESAVALDHLLDDSLEEKGCVQELEARVAVAAEGEEFVVEDILYECVTCGNNRSGWNESGLIRVRASQVARTVDGKELLASKVADDVDPSREELRAARAGSAHASTSRSVFHRVQAQGPGAALPSSPRSPNTSAPPEESQSHLSVP